MVLKDSSGAPFTCVDLDNLTSEAGFLALGRNRYHCAYTIYSDGTFYYAENGTTGALDYGGPNNIGVSGSNATLVIEAAMGALTAGRDWKEKIVLKGQFTIAAQIDMVSYVVLDMYGADFTLGFNGHMFNLSSRTDMEFLGGHFDGVKATYTTDRWSCFYGGPVDNLTIKDCIIHDFYGKGIFTSRVTDGYVENVISYSHGQDGIYFEGTAAPDVPSQRINIVGCTCYSNTRKGFNHGYIKGINYIGCYSYSNTEDGWNVEGGTLAGQNYYSEDVKLIGCHAYSNGWTGFFVQMGLRRISLTSCRGYGNTNHGLYIRGSDDAYTIYNIEVIGGEYYENEQHGILVTYGVRRITISGGAAAFNNDQSASGFDGITFTDTTNLAHVIIDDVQVYDDQGVATQDRGIEFGADVSGQNCYARNITGSGNTVELFEGPGVDVPTIVVPFVDGTDPQDSGFLINLATEYARTYLVLPPEANEVQRIQVYARSVVLEDDAMRLETVINGGADNEPFNTHVGSEANLASTSTNFAANDVIYWTCDPAGVLALTGGDSVEIRVIYEVAGGADCATDAYFRTASIEYV